jgi:putative nucleotidyltransferase with HDIG domain
MTASLPIDAYTMASPELQESSDCAARRTADAGQAASLLKHWFGVDFTVLDAETGDVLYLAADQPCRDWSHRAPLCQEVARRGKAEFIEEEFPLLMLAVAIPRQPTPLVGVATFLSRGLESQEEMARAANLLGCDTETARQWSYRQTPLSADVLQRLGGLALDRLEAELRIQTLQEEVDKLSLHVATTYEEISLLFRLTQNLRIDAKEAELAKMVLEWLVEIMPFEGMALQWLPRPNSKPAGTQSEQPQVEEGPDLISLGRCPLDNDAFTRLVQELGVHRDGHPVVINRTSSSAGTWNFPQVRQVILLPIGEGQQWFGYLAAFNHANGREFGTAEADLLSSVAAILGIHSGNAELYRQQAELLSGIVRALTAAIDAKDPYTCGHSDRVARVAVRLAQEMGCDPETIETLHLAGLLHDVGKIGIDDGVLRKPGKLTEAEFAHIQSHARIGYNILKDLKQLDKVLPVVLHHHESWDGSGYPEGLAGENIPALARIVAVCDAFDAMKSDRPYRQGMPDEKLDDIIRNGAGKQWDARVVEAFFRAREDIRAIFQRKPSDAFELPHYV